MIDVDGKTVLVTGGGAGTGLSTVRRFVELGAAPAVLEVDADLASALREELGPDSPFQAAVTGFTMSLALDLGPDAIRVNAVAPETTDTAQVPLDQMIHPTQRHNNPGWIPLGGFGAPDDSAGCVLFLASRLASWVSGTVVYADGGALAAAGWYRDDRNRWTNMPVIRGNSAVAADAGT